MFDQETVSAVERLAAAHKLEPAALLAIAEVEAAGHVFAVVRGKREPLIRWEGHYFDRRIVNGKRAAARKAGLASPAAGAVRNPSSQAKRWDIVRRAAAIDEQAAKESFSIGLGQVMTSHWRKLGFKSVDEMISLARKDAAGQIELMVRYIVEFGLADEVRRRDWAGFARGYNGPAYKKYRYHTKMAEAYARIIKGHVAASPAAGMLKMGASGAKVRELQQLLLRAGQAVNVDGDYGPSTKAAVLAFQKANKLAADGVAGPQTLRALDRFKTSADEQPGAQGATEIPEAKEGAGIGAGGVLVETVSQKVDELSMQTSGVPGLEWLSTILTVLAVLLVVGGIGWWAWGWWKSRRTDEGDIEPMEGQIDVPVADDGVLA